MRRAWIAVAALALVACRRAAEEREEPIAVSVRCVEAKRESVDVRVTMRGRVAAPPGADLPVASQVAGRVVQVLAHEGEHVDAGAVVAVIDDAASRDALRQADAAVVQAKAAEANAEATLQRTRELVARGIAAKQELDDATARADQARAAVASSAAAADLARRTLGRVQVRTTFGGVVTRVWRGAGALVDGSAATPILQLAATDLAEFDADATDRQIAGVAEGQAATISLATGGVPIEGHVRVRSAALDPSTGLGLVRIGIDGAGGATTLGVFGTAVVTERRRDDVLVVPAAAMRGAIADGAQLVVCKDGKAEVRDVRVGWRDDARVEIAGGLEPGERVAVDHVLGLATGAPIAPEQ